MRVEARGTSVRDERPAPSSTGSRAHVAQELHRRLHVELRRVTMCGMKRALRCRYARPKPVLGCRGLRIGARWQT